MRPVRKPGGSAAAAAPTAFAEYDFTLPNPLTDRTGNGRDLTPINGPVFGPTGVTLDGVNQSLQGSNQKIYGQWTIGFVGNFLQGSPTAVLVGEEPQYLCLDTANLVGFIINPTVYRSGTGPGYGAWQHLTASCLGDRIFIARNGTIIDTFAAANSHLSMLKIFDAGNSATKGTAGYIYVLEQAITSSELRRRHAALVAKFAALGVNIPTAPIA